ncbi:xylulokinase [Qipengyuania sp. JC766]|uniref:xylulokinase n=1 Tax=Qipengyuania sp. JC766 TaxID=3232139 RepID=UPI003458F4CF
MFLGIDIGTSGVKAIVLDEGGNVSAQGTAALGVQRPEPGWSEQDPEAWWEATCSAVKAIDSGIRGQVRAIGIAGQMHGAVLLGSDDRPLRPAILWNDGRSEAECEELEALVPDLRDVTGNIAMPGFTAPKLLWVRKHEPEVFDRIATVLLPKDYVRLVMTGAKATDLSDSAGTLWVDVSKRSWSDKVLAATGLDRDAMPRLNEGPEQTGILRADVAQQWGMARVPVMAGGGDNAAGAAGIGVVGDGDALLSLGTSGVIFVATSEFRPNPARAVHAFCHCVPDMWHQMSVHLSAASCIDWVARLTGSAGPADVFTKAEAAGAGAGPEVFLPYLSGERTPHNDARVRGAFLNLDNDSDVGRLSQAVLEGVAFALADGLDALRDAGSEIDQLSVIGGGARSQYWGQIISAACDVPLVYLKDGEVGPALGAARLAQIGVDGGSPADICSPPPVFHRIDPDQGIVDRLAPAKSVFRQAYSRITPRKGTIDVR